MPMEEVTVVGRWIDRGLHKGLKDVETHVKTVQHVTSGLTEITTKHARVIDIVANRIANMTDKTYLQAASELSSIKTKKELVDKLYTYFRGMRNAIRLQGKALGYTEEEIKRMSARYDLTKKEIASWGSRNAILNKTFEVTRKVRKGMMRFRMELLSVMFLGYAMNRVFGGLVSSSLKAAGVTELLSTTLKVAFLPAALAVLPLVISFMNLMMMIPTPIMTMIGLFFMLIATIGMLVGGYAALILGLTGLARMFGISVKRGTGFKDILKMIGKRLKETKLGTKLFNVGLIATGLIMTGLRIAGRLLTNTFKKICESIKRMKMGTKGMSVGFSLLGLTITGLTFAAKTLAGWIAGTGIISAAVLGPLALLGVVILGLVAYFLLFGETIEEWGEKTWSAWVDLQVEWQLFVDDLRDRWEGFKSAISKRLRPVIEWVQRRWEDVTTAFANLKEWVGEKWNTIVEWTRERWEDITEAFKNLGIWVNRTWRATVEWSREKWKDITESFARLGDWVRERWNVTVDFAVGIWRGVQDKIDLIKGWVRTGFDIAVNFVLGGGRWIASKIKGFLEAIGLQAGGIVTRPTLAYVGEKGPEAVIPLKEGGAVTTIYSSPVFNITPIMREEMDVDELSDILMRKWEEHFRTLTR